MRCGLLAQSRETYTMLCDGGCMAEGTGCDAKKDFSRRDATRLGESDNGIGLLGEDIFVPIWFSTNQRASCLEGPSPFLLRRLTRTVLLTVCL